jgi:AmmeMemoRadiSam system protein A
MDLTKEEKRALLDFARSSIKSVLKGQELPLFNSHSEMLDRKSGVFVTLKIDENLRGCIGYIESIFPLFQATQEAAVKAAMEDPRFMPLSLDELESVTIEISVLSPLSELNNVDKIEIGKHGLVIDAGYRRGLLLPQVATEYNWDQKEFLKHLSLKAGLPPDAWKQKEVNLYSFTVEKFDESEFARKNK